ncbi:hypothetical protein F2Q69_00013132 [Brassica cretica]|uniref:Uncharacterized protein n=1 Tax=Brassica cretica TaxID=69181 RepID=A0A8S9QQB4_BRACR|nr:hypothetical protein F2Q69_00013132 [Brassica cretica]
MFMKTSRASGYPLFWRSMDVSCPLSFVGEELVKLALEIPRRFRWVGFLLSLEALRHSCIWGSTLGRSLSAIYDNYHKAKTWKNYLPFEPNSSSPSMAPSEGSSTGAPSEIFCRLSTGDLWRLNDEIFSLRTGVQDLIIQRELAVQRTRVSARWELMKEWLEKKVGHWNPEEEYRQYLLVKGKVVNLEAFFRSHPQLRRMRLRLKLVSFKQSIFLLVAFSDFG